jgi:hypothetical protein
LSVTVRSARWLNHPSAHRTPPVRFERAKCLAKTASAADDSTSGCRLDLIWMEVPQRAVEAPTEAH